MRSRRGSRGDVRALPRVAALAAALTAVPAVACAPVPLSPIHGDARALLAQAHAEGLPFADPEARDAAMEATLAERVGFRGGPSQRMARLLHFLHDGDHAFRHAPGVTIPPRQAFQERRGDCMTHAVLFVSMARYLGVDAYYVRARTARQYLGSGDQIVAATHVAVGFDEGASRVVVDVWKAVGDYRLYVYDPIDDGAALALYFSNLAVDDMRRGRLPKAERALRFLDARAPAVEEVSANLAAVLVRDGRYDEALAVVLPATARFPRSKPLFTNGFLAAVGAGRPELARAMEIRGRAIAEDDPIFALATRR